MGAYIAIAAIIAWAIVQMSRNKTQGVAPGPDPEMRQVLEEMTRAMERADAERKRLTQRVQNLEAIVTTETFDLAQRDPDVARIDLPEIDADATPEEQVEQVARRIRH